MVKKKKPGVSGEKKGVPTASQKKSANTFSEFLSGPKSKWAFFAIYLIVTIFLFRDFLFSDDMLLGLDTIPDGIYTRQYYKEYHAEYGGIPHWNPHILGGLPFIDAMHGDTFYPGAWLKFFMPLTRALGHKLVWHVFLAGITMYLYLRTLRIRRDASFLGGLMYMLAPSFVTLVHPAHDAKMYIIALLPLAFALLERGINNPRFVTFAGLGGVMGLLILTSHAQMAYYSYWAIGLYFIFRLFVLDRGTTKKLEINGITKRTVMFVAAVIIAVTMGAVQILPAYKFTTKQSVRSGEERTGYKYATSWSMHPEETMGMVVPSFPGFIDYKNHDLYWGKNFFKLNTEYHGILPLVLGIMALLMLRNRLKWYFLGIAVLSLVYALGANTPFYRLFYAFVPSVKNFRAPSMIIFLFCFAFVTLASMFISSILDDDSTLKEKNRTLLYTIAVIAGLAVIISLMGQTFFDMWRAIFYKTDPYPELQRAKIMAANIPYFRSDMWRIAVLVCAALGGIWMFMSKRIGTYALTGLLALVIFVDEALIDSRFITTINPASNPAIAPDQTVAELQKRMDESGPFRILGIASGKSANYYAMFGLHTADGFHNNELQSYELFRGGRGNENFLLYWVEGGSLNPDNVTKNNFLNIAGVKYLIIAMTDGPTVPLENNAAFDRAFIVHNHVVVSSDSAAVELLKDSSFDPSETVIITGEPGIRFPESSGLSGESKVESLTYTKDGAVIKAIFHKPGFLVLADNMVPYWHADVDGKPAAIYPAYGTFMA
ncbi:MAG: hypothetical protein HOC71_07090, partial [Candidatus Latescibacteria bacterium]|nr:hypothetical protein [Candidatus Latescibacterota bacterium]